MDRVGIVAPVLDDDQDDGPRLRPLPSPDDRLWRHPSELGASGGPAPTPPPQWAPAAPVRSKRRRSVSIGVVSGLLGAAAMLAVLASIGVFDRHPARVAIEEVRVPITTTSDRVQALTAKVLPALVRVDPVTPAGTVSGTGIVFRTDGYILTTAENVHGARRITVQLSNGTTLAARLLGTDATSDVAVIRVTRTRMAVAVLADEDDVVLGEPTLAIDCVADRPQKPDVSQGVVNALGKRVSGVDGQSLPDMIQTNVPAAGDGAGAALVDMSGAVIGIVAATHLDPDGTTTTAADQTILVERYATPISYARMIADELIATGHVVHAWLGVETSDLSSAQQAAIGQAGAHVDRVVSDSPAQRAGLVSGDVVVGIDHTRITSSAALVVQLRRDRPDQAVSITYVRDGSERVTTATLANHGSGS